MKITKQRLKEIIKEEIEFLTEMGEDPDDWRDWQIDMATSEGEADGLNRNDRSGGYGMFQRYYDQAYDRAAKKREEETLELPEITPEKIRDLRQGLKRISRKRSAGDFRPDKERFKKP